MMDPTLHPEQVRRQAEEAAAELFSRRSLEEVIRYVLVEVRALCAVQVAQAAQAAHEGTEPPRPRTADPVPPDREAPGGKHISGSARPHR